MYKIKLKDKIAEVGLAKFTRDFECSKDITEPDAIMVRSTKINAEDLNPNLLAIARAGAGVNNIPIQTCASQGIVVFNTPGANANAVKELVLCGLLMASRKIVEAIDWTKKQTLDETIAKQCEKGKKQFVGPEIAGKKLGVIGLGAVGIKVANAAIDLEMDVYGYDPYLSVKNAWSLNKQIVPCQNLEEIFANSDYISIHIPATSDNTDFLDQAAFAKMKKGVKILNFARGSLVNNFDLLQALKTGQVGKYITDFASCELFGHDNIIILPHLGASTYESEENCAKMAANELMDYLENGNITNSVNFPRCVQERNSKTRICIINKNVPNILARISGLLAQNEINIENMVNRARGDYAYTLIDSDDEISLDVLNKISSNEDIIKIRVIK